MSSLRLLLLLSVLGLGSAEERLWFEVSYLPAGQESASVWSGYLSPQDYEKIVSGEHSEAFVRVRSAYLNMQNGTKKPLKDDHYAGDLAFRIANITSLVALNPESCEAVFKKDGAGSKADTGGE
jgi:hypothetical protein